MFENERNEGESERRELTLGHRDLRSYFGESENVSLQDMRRILGDPSVIVYMPLQSDIDEGRHCAFPFRESR